MERSESMVCHKTFALLCTVFFLTTSFFSQTVNSYIIRDPTFEVLKPRGLRVSIPAESGVQFFAFHGNVNKGIGESEAGDISGETFRPTNGRWVVEDPDVNLKTGDQLSYWFYVQADGSSYKKNDQTWRVVISSQNTSPTPGIEVTQAPISDPTSSPSGPQEGRLVLDENFNTLNKSLWSRELKMPLGPDYEFVVYHNENHQYLVQTIDGVLRIQPLILEDYYGENATIFGQLQLSGCTSTVEVECHRRGFSYNILPPIISGRLNTKYTFNFKYGKIEIRAKFPEGDWMYPELWLQPRYENYGTGYASGRVILGLARGNENLMKTATREIFDSRKLEFGLRVGMDTNVTDYTVSKINRGGPRWNQNFHVYTTIWTENGFQFLVDGQEVGRLTPDVNGWLQDEMFAADTKVAPFDQEFYLTIGVGVGGIREFPDGTISSGNPKPWKNVGAKAMLKFWHAKNQWEPSWKHDQGRKAALEVDYVRVWAF